MLVFFFVFFFTGRPVLFLSITSEIAIVVLHGIGRRVPHPDGAATPGHAPPVEATPRRAPVTRYAGSVGARRAAGDSSRPRLT